MHPHNLNLKISFLYLQSLLILLPDGYYYFQPGSEVNIESRKSIALLPLHNLTGDPDQSYYVDGLHDALIGELGQLSRLRVISRTSTLRFRDTQSDIRDIARQLDVNYIVEGSVNKADDSVRVQVQLIEVNPEEQHIWAESYERDTRDVLSMLSDVTREIAQTVEVTLAPVEDSLLADRREVNPESYKAYLRGSYELTRFTPESYQKGIFHLLKATRIDPADPLPWARLALGYNTAGHGGTPPPTHLTKPRPQMNIDDHLSKITLPILYIGAGGGLGAEEGEWTTSQTASDDVTIYEASQQPEARRNIDFGHADLFIANNAPELVWEKLHNWLIEHNRPERGRGLRLGAGRR